LKEVFDIFDRDKSGKIDLAEIKAVFEEFGFTYAENELAAAV